MNGDRVPIGNAISYGWESVKNNLGYFILAALILWLVGGIPGGLNYSTSAFTKDWAVVTFGILFALVSFVIGTFVDMSWANIGLRVTRNESPEYEDLYNAYPRFGDFLVGSILYFLIVLGGLILLIIPGIYWAVKYIFFRYLILDQGMKPFDAIKKSGEMTRGCWWQLLLYFICVFGINILGFILCCVGMLVTVPLTMVATAYVYRTLLATAQSGEQSATPPPPVTPPAEPAE